jgi:hypothetical protein
VPAANCITCDAPLTGRYCSACGEKSVHEQDLTLRAFAHYAVEAVTNADAKLYVSLRRLFRRPGVLTREFVAGRRKPYVGPLQLFLVSNLLFFVLLQMGFGWDTFTTDLAWHRTQAVYGGTAAALIEERVGPIPPREGRRFNEWIESWTEEQQELRSRFNDASPRYANSMVILMIPLFALGIRLLRRRGLFVRDLVFSMHLYAFMLLLTIVISILMLVGIVIPGRIALSAGLDSVPAIDALFRGIDALLNSELFITALFVTPLLAYVGAGFRTAYGDSTSAALLRAVAALMIIFFALIAYRGILFFVVFWTV